MAIYPGAVFYGNCLNNSGRRTAATRGAVVHVNDGQNVSLWHWVNDPASDMSCHFQILQNGLIEQYLDTDLFAWCQKAGNNAWISVEMPTVPTVGMTAAQIASAGKLIAWLSKLYGFPLQLTNDPNGYGIGWHGMGAHPGYRDDWGHPLCPGIIRRGQLPALLTAAKGGTTPEDNYAMPGYSSWSQAEKDAFWADGTQKIITRALGGYDSPETVGQALVSASQAARSAQADARNASTALNDTSAGLLVQVAKLQASLAGLPDTVAAKVAAKTGGTVDATAVAKEAVREALAELGAALDASTGAHAA